MPRYNGGLGMRRWYAAKLQSDRRRADNDNDPTPQDPENETPDDAGADNANNESEE